KARLERRALAVRDACAFGEDGQRSPAADELAGIGQHRPQACGPLVTADGNRAIDPCGMPPAGDAEQLLLAEAHRKIERGGQVDRLEEALVLDRVERRTVDR